MARIGPESALVAHCLEQASWHQTRALAFTREARAPQSEAPTEAPRALHLRALEHLVQAQRLVQQAQQASRSPTQAMVLAEHLARLQAIAADVEREASTSYLAASSAETPPSASS
ncbi:MAG TPA: hypothetical protein VII06_04640 [Chloroflexota bacterium]|jgi:hypothetical protein